MISEQSLLELKAKAFDLLIYKLKGKHILAGYKNEVIGFDETSENSSIINSKQTQIWEWTLQSLSGHDIENILLDEAARLLEND